MVFTFLGWGLVVGMIHFVVVGILYGNPYIDRMYAAAMREHPGVRRWDSRPKYLITQFLGTQIEVYLICLGFFWLRSLIPISGPTGALLLGLLLSNIRVYSRFWNMWIQSTYPRNLLATELVNGTIGGLFIVCFLELVLR